jgi:hypothetical protein
VTGRRHETPRSTGNRPAECRKRIALEIPDPLGETGGELNTEHSGAFVIQATVSAKRRIDLPAARIAGQSKKPVDATEVTRRFRRALPARVVEWHPMAWAEHTAAQPPDGTFINLSQVREIAANANGAPGRAHPVPA